MKYNENDLADAMNHINQKYLKDIDQIRQRANRDKGHTIRIMIAVEVAALLFLVLCGAFVVRNLIQKSAVADQNSTDSTIEISAVESFSETEELIPEYHLGESLCESASDDIKETISEGGDNNENLIENENAVNFGLSLLLNPPSEIQNAIYSSRSEIATEARMKSDELGAGERIYILYPFFIYEEDGTYQEIFYYPVVTQNEILFLLCADRFDGIVNIAGRMTEFNTLLSTCFCDNENREFHVVRHPVSTTEAENEVWVPSYPIESIPEETAEFLLVDTGGIHDPAPNVFIDLTEIQEK